jgi:homocysteine S-methyltransferase
MMPDGTPLAEAFAQLRAADVDVVGVNCGTDPAETLAALRAAGIGGLTSAFPSAGLPKEEAGGLKFPLGPAECASGARALAEAGVRLIGGCCGQGPEYIAAFTESLSPE